MVLYRASLRRKKGPRHRTRPAAGSSGATALLGFRQVCNAALRRAELTVGTQTLTEILGSAQKLLPELGRPAGTPAVPTLRKSSR